MNILSLDLNDIYSKASPGLAVFGAITLYFIFSFLVFVLIVSVKGKKLRDLDEDEIAVTSLLSGTFPISLPILLIIGFIGWLVEIVQLPYVAATKEDLQDTEERLTEKIEERCFPRTKRNNYQESNIPEKRMFKVGDVITGIKGNPGDYQHLGEGCVCRVVSIDENGSMEVLLIDHRDFPEQKEYIGNTFKAPARNFKLYRYNKPKRRR